MQDRQRNNPSAAQPSLFTTKDTSVTTPIVEMNPRTRREFCTQACQAASLLAVGAVAAACGGSPTSPSSSAPPLSSVSATTAGRVVSVEHRFGRSSGRSRISGDRADIPGHVSGGAHRAGLVHGPDGDMHPRGLHHHRIREQSLRVPVPRVAVHDVGRSCKGAGRAGTSAVSNSIQERYPDVLRVTAPQTTRCADRSMPAALISQARPSARSVRMPSQLRSTSYQASP